MARLYKERKIKVEHSSKLLEDKDGNIWFGISTVNGHIERYPPN